METDSKDLTERRSGEKLVIDVEIELHGETGDDGNDKCGGMNDDGCWDGQ